MMARLTHGAGGWMRRVVAFLAICAVLLPAAGFPHRAVATAPGPELAAALEFLICRGAGEQSLPDSGDVPVDPGMPSAGKCQACVLPLGALPTPVIAVSSRPIAIERPRIWSAAIVPAVTPPWSYRQPPPRAPPPAA